MSVRAATAGGAEALRLTDDGQVALPLRHPWRDGTTQVASEPVELLEKLAVLVPLPRVNLLLHHGVLATRATLRAEVVARTCTMVRYGGVNVNELVNSVSA